MGYDMSLPALSHTYSNRLLKGLVIEKVNKLSEQSGHVVISTLVVILVFTYMFVHPNASDTMMPIVGMIVGHFFGVQSKVNKPNE